MRPQLLGRVNRYNEQKIQRGVKGVGSKASTPNTGVLKRVIQGETSENFKADRKGDYRDTSPGLVVSGFSMTRFFALAI